MWSNIILNSSKEDEFSNSNFPTHPPSRFKHSGVLVPNTHSTSNGNSTTSNYDLYIYGGRSGTFPLKDFWKLDLKYGKWEEIKTNSSSQSSDDLWPPHLQEHSMVYYDRKIYVFGGEISFSYGEDLAPLWIFMLDTKTWRRWGLNSDENNPQEKGSKKFQIKSPDLARQAKTPLGRRGHSAVVWNNYMLIYGGYRDLKGSMGDLWAFHFDTESWHLFSSHDLHKKNSRPWYIFGTASSSSSMTLPCPRHSHVSVLHNNCFYVHGGMQDLTELQDLWKFDLKTRKWSNIKSKYGPGALHGHIGVCALDSLLIMAGERSGKAIDEFWRFDFSSEQWERVTLNGCRPCPRVFAWGGILPLVYRKVEGEQRSYLGHRRSPGQFDDIEEGSTTSTTEDNKYWWDYDESIAADGTEEAQQSKSPQPQPESGTSQQRRKSSLFSEFSRFAYSGDYQALSESNSVCLSEEEASPRPNPQQKWLNNGGEENNSSRSEGQSLFAANLKVINEIEAQGGHNGSASLIDLGEDAASSGHHEANKEQTEIMTSNGNGGPGEQSDDGSSSIMMTFDPVAVNRTTTYCNNTNSVGSRPLSASNSSTTRRSESANCLQLTNNTNRTKQLVKKSASVRFADIENNGKSSGGGPCSSSSQHQLMLMRECTSDYSSMDNGINQNGNGRCHLNGNGFENPNYHGSGTNSLMFGASASSKAIEMEAYEMGNLKPEGPVDLLAPPSYRQVVASSGSNNNGENASYNKYSPNSDAAKANPPPFYYEVLTPNYMLLIGGNESHSSQVVSKRQPLSIWRLRVTNELFSSANPSIASTSQGYESVHNNSNGNGGSNFNGNGNGGSGNNGNNATNNVRGMMTKITLTGPNNTTGF